VIVLAWIAASSLLVQQPPPQPAARDIDVPATNGLFEARIRRAAGQERVPEAIARWRLSVYELPIAEGEEPLWSTVVAHRAGERIHVLSDDGRAFAAIEPEYSDSSLLARIWRDGSLLTELSSTELGVDRSRLERADGRRPWLAGGEKAPRIAWSDSPAGPVPSLALTMSYGEERFVDLASGEVRKKLESSEELVVEPPASRAEKPGLRVPRIERFAAAARVRSGETLEVSVHGAHPTPNWLFVGFEIAVDREKGEILLSPVAAPPPKDAPQAQVIVEFDAVARVRGLPSGAYRLRVEGCDDEVQPPLPLEVAPAQPRIELARRGGIAGFDQTFRVYDGGIVAIDSRKPQRPRRFTVVPRAELRRMADLAVAVVREPAARARTPVADGFEYRVAIDYEGTITTRTAGELDRTGALAELIAAIERTADR
jgi:hypothetical protein